MGILNSASGKSIARGYDYFQRKKALVIKKDPDGVIYASVLGSGDAVYEVTVDPAHPRKSSCTCPHAAGKRIICKHMVAAFFTAFPEEAERYNEEREAYWREQERLQEEREAQMVRYIRKMKKSELQEALLQVLYEGPEWQYDRFIDENISWEDEEDEYEYE